LSRLVQAGPRTDLAIGWLVELELAEDEPQLAGQGARRRAQGEVRLLGVESTLLAPRSDERAGLTTSRHAVAAPATGPHVGARTGPPSERLGSIARYRAHRARSST
jgi:hypothetical protein